MVTTVLPALGIGAVLGGLLGAGAEAIKGIAHGTGHAIHGIGRGIGEAAQAPPGLEIPVEYGRGKTRRVHVYKVNAAQAGAGLLAAVGAYGLWCLIQHGPDVLLHGCKQVQHDHAAPAATLPPLAWPTVPPYELPPLAPQPPQGPTPPMPTPQPQPAPVGVATPQPQVHVGEWALPPQSVGAGDRLEQPQAVAQPQQQPQPWTPEAPGLTEHERRLFGDINAFGEIHTQIQNLSPGPEWIYLNGQWVRVPNTLDEMFEGWRQPGMLPPVVVPFGPSALQLVPRAGQSAIQLLGRLAPFATVRAAPAMPTDASVVIQESDVPWLTDRLAAHGLDPSTARRLVAANVGFRFPGGYEQLLTAILTPFGLRLA